MTDREAELPPMPTAIAVAINVIADDVDQDRLAEFQMAIRRALSGLPAGAVIDGLRGALMTAVVACEAVTHRADTHPNCPHDWTKEICEACEGDDKRRLAAKLGRAVLDTLSTQLSGLPLVSVSPSEEARLLEEAAYLESEAAENSDDVSRLLEVMRGAAARLRGVAVDFGSSAPPKEGNNGD